jgi:WD40 repeat protein
MPSQNALVTGGEDGIQLWDAAPPHRRRAVVPDSRGFEADLRLSHDGRYLAASNPYVTENRVRVWDLQALPRSRSVSFSDAGLMDVSPDGHSVITYAWGDRALIRGRLDPRDRRTLWKGETWGAAFAPDGRHVAVLGPRQVRILARDGQALRQVATRNVRGGLITGGGAFSDDSRQVAYVGDDGRYYVWSWAQDSGRLTKLRGPQGLEAPKSIQFLGKDGRLLMTTTSANLKVWDAHAPSTPPLEFPQSTGEIVDHAVDPSGRRIATVSDDHTVRTWACEACGPIDDVIKAARQRLR